MCLYIARKRGQSLDIVVVGIFLLRRGRSKRKSACKTVLAIGKTEGSTVFGGIVETFVVFVVGTDGPDHRTRPYFEAFINRPRSIQFAAA